MKGSVLASYKCWTPVFAVTENTELSKVFISMDPGWRDEVTYLLLRLSLTLKARAEMNPGHSEYNANEVTTTPSCEDWMVTASDCWTDGLTGRSSQAGARVWCPIAPRTCLLKAHSRSHFANSAEQREGTIFGTVTFGGNYRGSWQKRDVFGF